jgi:predicted RNA-binding protein YlqC (UPF0109 family)
MKSSPDSAPAILLELVQRLVVALVDRPEVVRIGALPGEGSVLIEIQAGPPEVGQIIGWGGRNILALKDIVMAVGAKHGIACQPRWPGGGERREISRELRHEAQEKPSSSSELSCGGPANTVEFRPSRPRDLSGEHDREAR